MQQLISIRAHNIPRYAMNCIPATLAALFLILTPHVRAMESLAFEYATTTSTSSSERGRAIAVDKDGNTYATGWRCGFVDILPGPSVYFVVSDESCSAFVQKLDPAGVIVWEYEVDGGLGRGIAIDPFGDVLVTGEFFGTTDFDSGLEVTEYFSGSEENAFVLKLTSDGEFVWVANIGNNPPLYGTSITTDDSGNVYTFGQFSSSADFDPGPDSYWLSAMNTSARFVQKLDRDGNFIWARSIPAHTRYSFRSGGIVVDSEENVYATGSFVETADFDPGPGIVQANASGRDAFFEDIFIFKLDADGELDWVQTMGSYFDDVGLSIALDIDRNVYVSGAFADSVDFDSGPGIQIRTATFERSAVDIFLLKLGNEGDFRWVRAIGGNGWEFGTGLAVDGAANVYTTGYFEDVVDFDPGPGTHALRSTNGIDEVGAIGNAYILTLDTDGAFRDAVAMPGRGSQTPFSIAADDEGNVYYTGGYDGKIDFDPGSCKFERNVIDNNLYAYNFDAYVSKFSFSIPEICEYEGENIEEGEVNYFLEGENSAHAGDHDSDGRFDLGELMRIVQFYNSASIACANPVDSTEDGYTIERGDRNCAPHDSDYDPKD